MLDCLCCAVCHLIPSADWNVGRLSRYILQYSLLFLQLCSALLSFSLYFIISPSLYLLWLVYILVVSHFAWRHRNLIRKNYTVKNNLVNLLVSAVNRNIPRKYVCENRIILTLGFDASTSSPHIHTLRKKHTKRTKGREKTATHATHTDDNVSNINMDW